MLLYNQLDSILILEISAPDPFRFIKMKIKAFIKLFEAPPRSVKKKRFKLIFSLFPRSGQEGLILKWLLRVQNP